MGISESCLGLQNTPKSNRRYFFFFLREGKMRESERGVKRLRWRELGFQAGVRKGCMRPDEREDRGEAVYIRYFDASLSSSRV